MTPFFFKLRNAFSNKTTLVAGLLVLVFLALMLVVSRLVIEGRFDELEKQFCVRNIVRSRNVVQDKVVGLSDRLSDWSSWDDTYAFMQDRNQAYIDSNLAAVSLAGTGLNFLVFIDAKGQVFYSFGLDPESKTEIPVPGNLLNILVEQDLFQAWPDFDNAKSGIVMLAEGPLMFSARQILTSESKGPSRGILVFAQYLSGKTLDALAGVIQQKLDLKRLDDGALQGDFALASEALGRGAGSFVATSGSNELSGYSLVNDVFGKPIFVLRVTMLREISRFGKTTFAYFAVFLPSFGLVFGLAIFVVMRSEIRKRKASEEALRLVSEAEKGRATELNAANQQLHAHEQQLKATNELLEAKEQSLRQSQEELKNKLSDLERFNHVMVGRELEMVKLKKEVNSLLTELQRASKYKIVN